MNLAKPQSQHVYKAMVLMALVTPWWAYGVELGQYIYTTRCAVCHGDDGTGAMPGIADLTEPGGPLSKADAVLLKEVINGVQRPGVSMPPRGGDTSLSDADINAALRYLRRIVEQTATQPISKEKE
jgi:cytochrome c5